MTQDEAQDLGSRIKAVGDRFDGFSGNCARFAVALNQVLDADGDYVIVNGEHYEYADHVMLRHRGWLFDASGLVDLEALREECDEDDTELEDFPDASPDGRDVRRLADDGNELAARWVDEDLVEALREALDRQVFPSPGG